VFLDFEHLIARFTRIRINRIAWLGADGEDAMNFVCRRTVKSCPSPVQFRQNFL
jgi:hypothetical protein